MDNMSTQKKPILTDEFLDELAKEISQLYGGPEYEKSDLPPKQGN
jgi:hypothetical protein